MPANDHIWLDDRQVLSPIGQKAREQSPESPIIWFQSWPLGVSLEGMTLMAESDVFKNKSLSGFERGKQEIQHVF